MMTSRQYIFFWVGITFFLVGILLIFYTNFFYIKNSSENSGSVVKVYFPNKIEDPETIDCSKSYSSYRNVKLGGDMDLSGIVESSNIELGRDIFLSVDNLLAGPTPQEQANGFFTAINPGVRINHIIIEEGEVSIDFSEDLNNGVAGSCRVGMIRSQIESTIGQFSQVKKINIFVQGRTEDILQP